MTSLAAPSPHPLSRLTPRLIQRLIQRLIPGIVVITLGGVLVCATLARLEHFASAPAAPPVIAKAELTFTDLADGGVSVRNASGQVVATIPSRDDGFLRMTLRLLAAARLRQHIGQEQPFMLTEFTGGRMLLADPATGLSIELEAFGPSNVGEFTHFFTPEAGS
jgi:putative photosynthetic complex assembly protein